MGYDKIPRQKLSINKKNKKWGEECVEAFIDLSNSEGLILNSCFSLHSKIIGVPPANKTISG